MSTALMARKQKRDPKTVAIAKAIFKQYSCKNVEDMQEAIKRYLWPDAWGIIQGEIDSHLGYKTNDHGHESTKTAAMVTAVKPWNPLTGISRLKSRGTGTLPLNPRQPQNVLGMKAGLRIKSFPCMQEAWARGLSQIPWRIFYGFEISHDIILAITDRVIETAQGWQNRPTKTFYPFLFVDCLYVSVRKKMETKNLAVYVILGYDINGVKDLPGLWIGEAEGKHYWMQIFDEIKARGRRCCLSAWMEYPGWKKG